MMDINDAKAVIKGLQEEPFICSKNAIETNNGFIIKRIPRKYSKADKIRLMSDEELAKERIDRIDAYTKSDLKVFIGDFAGIVNSEEEAIKKELEWLQSEAE